MFEQLKEDYYTAMNLELAIRGLHPDVSNQAQRVIEASFPQGQSLFTLPLNVPLRMALQALNRYRQTLKVREVGNQLIAILAPSVPRGGDILAHALHLRDERQRRLEVEEQLHGVENDRDKNWGMYESLLNRNSAASVILEEQHTTPMSIEQLNAWRGQQIARALSMLQHGSSPDTDDLA